jgi:glycosyltransferase involved in cell wall biosynthesis
MHILYLCEEYPPGKNGGIGSMVKLLATTLAQQGHQVYVLGLYPHGYDGADEEEDNGVKIFRLRYRTDWGLIRNNFSFTDNLLYHFLRLTGLLNWDAKHSSQRLFNKVQQLVKQHAIDIIEMPDWNTFLHNSRSPITVPAFAALLVVKFHGGHSYLRHQAKLPVDPTIFAAEKALLQRATALVSVSQYTAQQTTALFGINRPVKILYNGIQLPPAHTLPVTSDKVVFAGALSVNKGAPILLQAWNLVYQQCPNATLHLYGKGPVHQLKKILQNGAAATVHFYGHVPRQEVLSAFGTAEMSVFPSQAECFALAPLEAMAAGAAVIYTRQSSGPELIDHGQNGLLINPNSAEDIAAAIIQLLQDRPLRNRLAAAGKATVAERFNIQQIAQQHLAFYKEVIMGLEH